MSTYTVLGITASTGSEVQSKIANGTTGQVLTATTGALPSFQDASSSGGKLIQQIYSSTSSLISCTTDMPADDTIPQNNEGDEVLTATITPTNSSNYLHITFTCWESCPLQNSVVVALFQDSTANALAAIEGINGGNQEEVDVLTYRMTAGTTSSTTFKIRIGTNASTVYVNGINGSRRLGGVSSTTLTITEIEA